MNLQVLCGLLTRTEMRMDTAESGHACIAAFAENDYDLIFLDYRMPVMDGSETPEALWEMSPDEDFMRHGYVRIRIHRRFAPFSRTHYR